MGNQNHTRDDNASQTGGWIQPFGNVFIGLSDTALIRRVIGVIDTAPGSEASGIEGMHWDDFVDQFAADHAKDGLLNLWAAIAGQHVAAAHWPAAVPFAAGTVAQLREVTNNPTITYAVHLGPAVQCNLDALIGTHTLNATQQLIQLSQSVFRGVHGPLTDPQVKAMSSIVTLSETVNQLLNDLRTEITAPATMAPMPLKASTLFAYAERDFATIRRIATHQLALQTELAEPVQVYCYASIRGVVRRILETLLASIAAQTSILLALPDTTTAQATADTVQLSIAYQSKEPELHVKERIDPVDLFDAERFYSGTTLQRLITAVQSHMRPINGHVWAEPVTDSAAHNMRICIVLPRWKPGATSDQLSAT